MKNSFKSFWRRLGRFVHMPNQGLHDVFDSILERPPASDAAHGPLIAKTTCFLSSSDSETAEPCESQAQQNRETAQESKTYGYRSSVGALPDLADPAVTMKAPCICLARQNPKP